MFLCRLMCSSVSCIVGSHLEVIPMIWKQLGSMSTTHKQNYFGLWQLLRGLQDTVDVTIGKILLLPSCRSVSGCTFFIFLIDHSGTHL